MATAASLQQHALPVPSSTLRIPARGIASRQLRTQHPCRPRAKAYELGPTRRAVLSAGLALSSAVLAGKAVAAPGTPISTVVPAKTVEQYLDVIHRAQPQAWQTISRYIASGDYAGLSISLVLGPIDDVRQACFYLPWALLPRDVDAAVRCQEAYSRYLSSLKELDAAALAARRYSDQTEERVQVAFEQLTDALDAFLQQVPV